MTQNENAVADVEDKTEDFEVGDSQVSKKEHIHAQFGCKQTHKEQIIVTPCGMIITWETFFGTEGVGSVVVSVLVLYVLHYTYLSTGNDQAHVS